MKKKVDDRIRVLLENNVKLNYRTLFVIVGDKGKEQVMNIYYMLSHILSSSDSSVDTKHSTASDGVNKSNQNFSRRLISGKPSVLWCYKKELGFSSHKKKRMKQLKRKMLKGNFDPNLDNPFELFVTNTSIRYCFYKETQSVLGQTCGMCILQDFEALTPDILCRTIETVAGGGVICVLLHTMSSLTQLYTLVMEAHRRYQKAESELEIEPRFNERFLLSLADCETCLVIDDELNILPLSSHAKHIEPVEKLESHMVEERAILDELINSTNGSLEAFTDNSRAVEPWGSCSSKDSIAESSANALRRLVQCAITVDQAKAIMTVVEKIGDKSTVQIVSLTAGRGRGKSAVLGLCAACAIVNSYSNIYVTAPYAENVGTVFEFAQKGIECLGLTIHKDFDILKSDPKYDPNKYNTNAVSHMVQINVFRTHKQFIRFVDVADFQSFLPMCELLIIDEAAAIPAPIIKKLIGSFPVLMASTVNGYEGTGRSLSLKLFHSLRNDKFFEGNFGTSKMFTEITLERAIRYANGDPVEAWLYRVLCLDATNVLPLRTPIVPPNGCTLYMINRTALFSYNTITECLLSKIISLFVSSHYKNSPNDLMLLADAPAHFVFALLPTIIGQDAEVPDVYCAIQVAIEGGLGKEIVSRSLSRGVRPSGDLIPWTLSEYYHDHAFPLLTGIRIVRIAVHPNIQKLGYGSCAMQQLISALETQFVDMPKPINVISSNENKKQKLEKKPLVDLGDESKAGLRNEKLCAKVQIPPLFVSTRTNRCIESPVNYIGVCYGCNVELLRFWLKLGFRTVYIKNTVNEVTGEYSVIMLRRIQHDDPQVCRNMAVIPSENSNWLSGFLVDFRNRFVNLLSFPFRNLSVTLALSLLQPPKGSNDQIGEAKIDDVPGGSLPPVSNENLLNFLTYHDIDRLRCYVKNLCSWFQIQDVIFTLASLFLNHRFPNLVISYVQLAVLVGFGCQRRTVEDISTELKIPTQQTMALLNKCVTKLYNYLDKLIEKEVIEALGYNRLNVVFNESNLKSLEDEENEQAKVITDSEKREKKNVLEFLKNNDSLKQYTLEGVTDKDFEKALMGRTAKGSVSIKKKQTALESIEKLKKQKK